MSKTRKKRATPAEMEARRASRERSDGDATTNQATVMGLEGGDPRSPNKGTRPPRVPMGAGKNLDVGSYPLDPNFYHHWFYDHPSRPGRAQKAEAAYYEYCLDKQGKKIKRGSDSGIQYLMRLPMDFREDDLALKRIKVERTMSAETRLAPDEYAPTEHHREGGKSAVTRDRQSLNNPFS